MDTIKYVAIDVHIASLVVLVMSVAGKVLQEKVISTTVPAIRQFLKELRGKLIVTFEEGTLSQWLYEVIEPLADQVIVCNPRRNKILAEGSKSDRIDVRKLADLLRTGMLKPVYHAKSGDGMVKELVHCYQSLVSDCNRVMNRLKAVYRSRGITTTGRDVYYKRNREQWLAKFDRAEKRQRAQVLYREFDCLRQLRRETRRDMLVESRRHAAWKILRTIPGLGPIRTAIIIAIIRTPHRFRTKRQLWAYCGFSVVTKSSSDYVLVEGAFRKSNRVTITRGLTRDFNRLLKGVIKSAASDVIRMEPFKSFYNIRISAGMSPEMARLTVARKIAAIILVVWKTGVAFDPKQIVSAA